MKIQVRDDKVWKAWYMETIEPNAIAGNRVKSENLSYVWSLYCIVEVSLMVHVEEVIIC